MNRTILKANGNDTDAFTIFHKQIKCEIFDEIVTVIVQRLAVQCVQQWMSRSIGDGTASVRLATFAIVIALTTEGTLIDFTFFCSWEWHSVVFQLDDSLRRFACHIMNGILIAKPIRTFDCVVAMEFPIVWFHVAQCGIDTTWKKNGKIVLKTKSRQQKKSMKMESPEKTLKNVSINFLIKNSIIENSKTEINLVQQWCVNGLGIILWWQQFWSPQRLIRMQLANRHHLKIPITNWIKILQNNKAKQKQQRINNRMATYQHQRQ